MVSSLYDFYSEKNVQLLIWFLESYFKREIKFIALDKLSINKVPIKTFYFKYKKSKYKKSSIILSIKSTIGIDIHITSGHNCKFIGNRENNKRHLESMMVSYTRSKKISFILK